MSTAPPTITIELATSWVAVLMSHGGAVEVRSILADGKGARSRVFPAGTKPHEIVTYALTQDRRREVKGVYLTLNPLRADIPPGRFATDADVTGRHWLLIDCDPTRPADTNATDAEKAAAYQLALTIRDALVKSGLPEPILADSGNGWHLLWRIDLPNDAEALELVRALLAALDGAFSTEAAGVDVKVSNASRICKFYGTTPKKGEATSERPHRPSRIAEIPEPLAVVTEDALRRVLEILNPGPDPAPRPDPAPNGHPAGAARMRFTAGTDGRPDAETRAIVYLAKCDPAVSGQKGHDRAFGVACRVGPGFDLPPETALRLIREHYNPGCQPLWSEKELEHKVADAYRVETRRGWLLDQDRPDFRGNGASGSGRRGPGTNGTGHDGDSQARDERPAVNLTADIHKAADRVLEILPKHPDLFRRGGLLVTVGIEPEDEVQLTAGSVMRNVAGVPKVIPLSPALVGYHLSRIAAFYKWRKDKAGEDIAVQVPPSAQLVAMIHGFGIYPGVRHLLGVAECPYPCRDGSIASKPGYDPETGTLVLPFPGFIPPEPRPDQKAAREAAGRILAVVKQFPFAADEDRAVWLAGLLTEIARPAINGPVPGVAINGNVAGCGKGLLVDEAAIIATGRSAPTTTYPDDTTEAGKVKTALALAAPPVVHFDNLEEGSFYGNSSLDSALTATVINDRILGESRSTGDIVLRTTWWLSGNNIAPGKDAHRRWLPCNLVSSLEHPEEREDIKEPNLRAYTLARRAELVRDALTILQAHARAGYPAARKARLGSFEEWDRLIRGAVHFAYGVDPCETRRKAAEDAPERKQKLALLEAWRTLPGGSDDGPGVTTQEAVEMADRYPDLHAALIPFSRDGKTFSTKSLGKFIGGMKGANIGGLRFEKAGEKQRAALWRVVNVVALPPPTGPEPSEFGEFRESESNPSRASSPQDHDVKESESKGKNESSGQPTNSPNSQTHSGKRPHAEGDSGPKSPATATGSRRKGVL